MIDIFWFGNQPKGKLPQMLSEAGYRLLHVKFTPDCLTSPEAKAVILHWKSKAQQQVILYAKTAGLPVLVITSRLADAIQAGEPQADVYLESPAKDEEVVAFVADLLAQTTQPRKVAASVQYSDS